MTHLFSQSNANHPQVHLPAPPILFAIFFFSVRSTPVYLDRSTDRLTSRSLPGYFAKQILPTSSLFSLFFSSLFYRTLPIPFFFHPLPVVSSSLYLHPLIHPTYSEGPRVRPRTPSTLRYSFALFSNSWPLTSSPCVPQRSLTVQIHEDLLKPYLSKYFYKSNHSRPSSLFASICSPFFLLSLFQSHIRSYQ